MFGYKLIKKTDYQELVQSYYEFENHTWENCVMKDSKGKSASGTYNEKEIEEAWDKYHSLADRVRLIFRKLA